jgi:glycosyltransferase involved in cell wall biosynthesis
MRLFDVKALGEIAFETGGSQVGDAAVVIPLYNYEQYIVETLRSVVDQTLERLSVVVVDDASTDEGPRLAAGFLAANASRFVSARVVRHKTNQGLSMARNSGVAWSAEPLLFMLDADNIIRPPALERLKSALDVDGADFAYSQLFIFGRESAVGIADIWGVDRLRDCNTIDAMALIRREALEETGGYALLADDHGWEDYDLWCRLFTLGKRGIFLPELLCEYRRHDQSMLNIRTNKNHVALIAEMALRYPGIFIPAPTDAPRKAEA